MEPTTIRAKFGDEYRATEATFRLGIDTRITKPISERFFGRVVLETCTGGGFTTIALARVAKRVFSVEVDPQHLAQAMDNVAKAGVSDRVTLILGDCLSDAALSKMTGVDAAFLDPDWAVTGPDHIFKFRESNMRPPADALLAKILDVTDNVALILPPSLDLGEIDSLPAQERQSIYLDRDHVLYCIYFGNLATTTGETYLQV